MHQAQLTRTQGVDPLGRLEVAVTLARTNGPNHIGADGGRDDAELDFGSGEHRLGRRHRNVASSGEAGAAAQRRALHPGNRRLFHFGQHAQHAGQRARVTQVVFHAVLRGTFHPVQISPRREAFAAPGEYDHAHAGVGIERFASCSEFGDQGFVKSVVDIRAVHPHSGDAVVLFYF